MSLGWLVDVHLIYHGGGELQGFPSFYWTGDFLRGLLQRPGGLGSYIAAAETQTLAVKWLGAGALTLQAGILWLLSNRYCGGLWGRSTWWPGYLLGLGLLCCYARFSLFATPLVHLTLTLGGACLHGTLPRGRPGARLVSLALLGAALYAAAAGAFAIFATCAALIEWRVFRSTGLALVSVLLGILVPGLEGTLVYGLAPDEIVSLLGPGAFADENLKRPAWGVFLGLWCLVPALGAALTTGRWLSSRGMRPTDHGKPVHPGRRGNPKRSAGLTTKPAWHGIRFGLGAVAPAACMLLAAGLCLDRNLKASIRVDHLCSEEQWVEALHAAEGHLEDPFIAASYVQAAYHEGRLLSELPRLADPEDLLLTQRGHAAHWRQAGFSLDLGFPNLAFHHLTEAVEFWGERPLLLERLAWVHLALGNPDMARVYLRALTRVPFCGKRARAQLESLDRDPSLNQDVRLGRLRSLGVTHDEVGHWGVEAQTRLLLEANPKNRMAYVYRMTHALMRRDLPGFATGLPAYSEVVDAPMTELWKEAVVLVLAQPSFKPPSGIGPQDPSARERFEHFVAILKQYGTNREGARQQLEKQYGRTYFYYYLFGR